MTERPTPRELWLQAGGGTATYSRERYLQLMREHGHLIPGKPQPLPCGWPHRERALDPTRRG